MADAQPLIPSDTAADAPPFNGRLPCNLDMCCPINPWFRIPDVVTPEEHAEAVSSAFDTEDRYWYWGILWSGVVQMETYGRPTGADAAKQLWDRVRASDVRFCDMPGVTDKYNIRDSPSTAVTKVGYAAEGSVNQLLLQRADEDGSRCPCFVFCCCSAAVWCGNSSEAKKRYEERFNARFGESMAPHVDKLGPHHMEVVLAKGRGCLEGAKERGKPNFFEDGACTDPDKNNDELGGRIYGLNSDAHLPEADRKRIKAFNDEIRTLDKRLKAIPIAPGTARMRNDLRNATASLNAKKREYYAAACAREKARAQGELAHAKAVAAADDDDL